MGGPLDGGPTSPRARRWRVVPPDNARSSTHAPDACVAVGSRSRWTPRPPRLGCSSDMRLWTLHPRHLDAAGLVALWREALLAQAVLLGRTRGYTRHPQLQRFQAATDPAASIAAYLRAVSDEATTRGYAFDASRIVASEGAAPRIAETKGQLLYEWE